MNTANSYALAIDIGATKLAAGVVSRRGLLTTPIVRRSPQTKDALLFAQAVSTIGRDAMTTAGLSIAELTGVGCGCGGPIENRAGRVSPTLIPAWRGFPLKEYLESEFGTLARVDNDAMALAIGEHWVGSGNGTANMLAVTVSTGVGGGLILDGKPYRGKTGNAGHFGHLIVDPRGPRCDCGAHGCVQAFASGPNAVKLAADEGWAARSKAPDGIELAASAAEGDPIATQTISRAGWAVGGGMALCATLLDLELFVIAGGFSHSGNAFWQSMISAFNERAGLDFVRRARFARGAAETHAPLMGAAALVLNPDRYDRDRVLCSTER